MFDLFFSFAPWIVFSSVNRSVGFAAGIGLALAIGAAVVIRSKRRGTVHLLDIASLGFFALVLAVVLAVQPDAAQLDTWSKYLQSGSYAALTLIVFGSIAVRRPFTISYAKEGVPEEFWDTDIFLQINNAISARWGGAFAVGAVTTALAANVTGTLATLLHITPYVALYLAYRYTQRASRDDGDQPADTTPAAAAH